MPISLNKMDFYKMDHKNRGYVVIISNFEFTTESIVNDDMFKEGQKKDVENYKELFKALSFKEAEITVYENKTAEEMQNIMKEYANDKDYTDCDCFIAVFLSHGKLLNNEQYIYGTDKSMKFHQNCTDVFKKTETLIKKPKLFFIDICRGKEDEPTCSKSPEHLLANSKIETEKESLESATSNRSKESFTNSDFFFGWASVNGFKAKLNESGSWFSTALCEVIKDNFHRMDLLEMDVKVRDKLKEEKKIVTSQSTSTLTKKCFFGPRNGNKNIRSTFKKILTVNTCWSVSNKGEYSFIFDYFKPLIEYSNGEPYTNTVLNQPLWFNRQQKLKLEEKSIEEELSKIINENNDISFLARCIHLSFNKTTSYSQLSYDDRSKLIKILSSSFDPYATSLLITFLIRDNNINLRKIAVELLKKGESSLDSVELKIFEGEKFELIENTFIDLTNARLTDLDLNWIDFSGQNLNYSIFQESSIENVKFNYCSLENSNFNLSRLRFCYFNHSHLFKCNLKVTAISCHFNDCFLVNANLSSSTFEKCVFNASNFEKAILTKCSFDDSSFENVLDLNKEQLLNQSISFRNECLIDDSLFLSNKQYFEDIRKKKGIKLKIQGLNRQLEGHSDSVRCLVKLKNGHLASGSWDKKIKLWDTNTGQCIQTLEGHSNNVYSLIELENGHLASSSDDKTIKLWNIENGECFNTFKGHSKTVYCLVELKNGLLASGSLDKTIKLWNTTTGECIKTLEKHLNSINCLIEFKNGYLASGSEDTTIKLWNIETGRCKTLNGHSSTVYCLVELKNGDLASGSWDKKIFLWNTTTFQLIKTLGGHSYSVNCLIELNNGHLASGSSDNTIKLWNTKTNECIHTLDGHSGSIICLIEFKNGHLASGSSDTTIKLWEYASLLGPI